MGAAACGGHRRGCIQSLFEEAERVILQEGEQQQGLVYKVVKFGTCLHDPPRPERPLAQGAVHLRSTANHPPIVHACPAHPTFIFLRHTECLHGKEDVMVQDAMVPDKRRSYYGIPVSFKPPCLVPLSL